MKTDTEKSATQKLHYISFQFLAGAPVFQRDLLSERVQHPKQRLVLAPNFRLQTG